MVIQRWQSLLLLCVSVLMGCFTFASLGQVQAPDFTLNFTSMGFCYVGEATNGAPTGTYLSTWYFFTVALTSMLLPLINIFLFKNLKLQKKVCLVEILFIIVVAAIAASLGYTAVENGQIVWSQVIVCPLIALIADIMAYRRIESDRRLILSADRLR